MILIKISFEYAAIREAYEETGIEKFVSCNYIGKQEINLSGKYTIFRKAKVYSRPDL
jgi:8-oxo-dGTP pyrophosphatase MutT (NUDIX family)